MSLVADERTLYEGLWTTVDAYGIISPGATYLPLFLQMVGDERGHVLDAGTGCGKGAVALAAADFRVTCCDLTASGLAPEARALPFHEACLWHDLKGLTPTGTFDWVYCCDVLEHLPAAFTMLAVEQMLRVSRCGVFLAIALSHEGWGIWAGRASLHQTVQSFVWWRDALTELGTVVEARDLLAYGHLLRGPAAQRSDAR